MKANESDFAFIGFHLFFRIETFQSVAREKSKKFRPASQVVGKTSQADSTWFRLIARIS
jgi:hypothetical protein